MTGERSLYFVGFVICVITYQVWSYLPKGTFYYGMAISWFVIALHDTLRTADKVSFEKYSLLVMIAAINNILDELWFNPGIFGINDGVVAGIIILGMFHPSKRITWQKDQMK